MKRTLNFRRSFASLSMVIVLLLSACTDNLPASNPGDPTLPPGLGDAQTVARQFLDAWSRSDYDGMYTLLSPRSLIISKEAFTDAYVKAEQTMQIAEQGGKEATIESDQGFQQGTTAAIRYNMKFRSRVLGEFEDKGRTLRLVISPRGWRVAWSTMDIFEGMAGGATLQLNRTPAQRGTILDRNDQLLAQDDIANYAIRLITRRYPTGNADVCLDKLAEMFRLYRPDLEQYKQFTGLDNGYTVATIAEADLQAVRSILDPVCLIDYQRQVTRFVYGGGVAAQTVGFVGPVQRDQVAEFAQVGEGGLVGQFGVERAWQQQLGGTAGAELVIRTADGVLVRTIYRKGSTPGQDVRLTIDRGLQLRVEEAIASAYNAANWGKLKLPSPLLPGASIVVIDVKTGAILAMASFPSVNPDAWLLSTTFDVGTIQGYLRKRAIVNKATDETKPLGSVMKIASMAAAAGTGQFKVDERVNCTGLYPNPSGNPKFLTDWIYLEPGRVPNYHGEITLPQGLTSSCDVYFWTIAERLNNKSNPACPFYVYANMLGLGVKTGIDSITEEAGYIPSPDEKFRRTGVRWGVGDCLNVSIGQGDTQVTVLQVAKMVGSIANGKQVLDPYLVRAVGLAGQSPTYLAQPGQAKTLDLAPEIVDAIREGLCNVTTDPLYGTAKWVFERWDFNQIRVCGKTGTAQSGTDFPHGWFAAYAGLPGQTPDIAIAGLVMYSREGSETAAPIVRRVLEAYYRFPYTPWPEFWSQPYETLPKPGLGEGGPPKR